MRKAFFFSDEQSIVQKAIKTIGQQNNPKMLFWTNSFAIDPKDQLARIMRLDHFIQLLVTQTHYMSAPLAWEDPWEAKIYRNIIRYYRKRLGNADHSFEDVLKQFFASCWSRQPDDLAMWQGYTSRVLDYRLRCVQVVTTAKDLFSAFNVNTQRKLTLGGIVYLSSTEIKRLHKRLAPNYANGKLLGCKNMDLYPLFIKRRDFAHENEVRLVYQASPKELDREETQRGEKVKYLSIKIADMKRFIHKIILDPWCSQKDANSIKSYIQGLCPSLNLTIEQSKISLNN